MTDRIHGTRAEYVNSAEAFKPLGAIAPALPIAFPTRPFEPGSYSEFAAAMSETACWWADRWPRHKGWVTREGRWNYDFIFQVMRTREEISARYLWTHIVAPWLTRKLRNQNRGSSKKQFRNDKSGALA